MEIDREALWLAVQAASHVMAANHSVPIFSKVWLMDNHVLAFNNTGMVIHIPIDMPVLGGVDGKLLASLLDKSGDEMVTVEVLDGNKAKFQVGRSTATLAVIDPVDYVRELAELPKLKSDVLNIYCTDLQEKLELDALLNVATLKNEQAVDFSSLCIHGQEGKLAMYVSDRLTINRSVFSAEVTDPIVRLVPLNFMRTLRKLWSTFEEGTLSIDSEHAIARVEEGPTFYTKLARNEQPIDFKSAIGRMWPGGKIDTKTLVAIPDDLVEVLIRASLFAKSIDEVVMLSAENDRLLITANGPGGHFKESIKFKHPAQKVFIKVKPLLAALKYANRMYLPEGRNGIALFGNKRFSKFIAGTTTANGVVE